MSLVTSSAYTETWRTSYFFNTAAGVDTFFDVFAEQQRAMLHPDYSDAEIRLEVRNFGVTKSADGTPAPRREGHGLQRDGGLDGQRQLAGLAGAEPRGLRHAPHAVVQPGRRARGHPDDDARGHPPLPCRHPSPRQHGHGGRVPEVRRARRPAGALRPGADEGCAEGRARARPIRSTSCRKPAGDPEGALRIYEYPHTNAQQPSPVAVVWPASRELDAAEQLLAELFFANLAGDASTNLYGLLIDSRSRRLDTGAALGRCRRSGSGAATRWRSTSPTCAPPR